MIHVADTLGAMPTRVMENVGGVTRREGEASGSTVWSVAEVPLMEELTLSVSLL